jgi:citrate lyase alpha subunit
MVIPWLLACDAYSEISEIQAFSGLVSCGSISCVSVDAEGSMDVDVIDDEIRFPENATAVPEKQEVRIDPTTHLTNFSG